MQFCAFWFENANLQIQIVSLGVITHLWTTLPEGRMPIHKRKFRFEKQNIPGRGETSGETGHGG